jgi:protein EFR3
MKDEHVSPYLLKTRPIAERRATSVHLHKDGDKGPSFADVVDAALRVYSSLVGQSHGAQLGLVMQAAFDSLDTSHSWEQVDHCCWLAQASADWAQYQYRYAIPSRLVERLLESQDTSSTTPSLVTLTAMVTTVFVSPTPLVNLSTSDMVSNLISVVLRRTALDPEDPLLSALVKSMASLGTHVYYADQIQDLAAELISRLTVIELGGVGMRGKSGNSKSRSQAIRCLLAGLLGLIHVADNNQAKLTGGTEEQRSLPAISPVTDTSNNAVEYAHKHVHPSRRTKVSPEIWIETLTLLCDGDFTVRADYALTLVSYIKYEIPRRGDRKDADGVKRMQSLSDGPIRQAKTTVAILYGDSITRFLNALHAYIFALATSSCLGILQSGSVSPTPPSPSTSGDGAATINVIPATPDSRAGLADGRRPRGGVEDDVTGTSNLRDSPLHSESQSRRSTVSGPRSRQVSSLNQMLNFSSVNPSSNTFSSSATLSDYAHIVTVLTLIHEQLPVRSLLTSVPMLSALEQDIQGNLGKHADVQRLNVIREVLARVWLAIGRVWDCQQLVEAAEQVIYFSEFAVSGIHISL